jgi:hypothetical protein
MKRSIRTPRFLKALSWLLAFTLTTTSCQDHQIPLPADASTYSSDVVRSWFTMQLKLTLTAPGGPAPAPRRYAYSGIALYESIVPGLAGYQSIAPN